MSASLLSATPVQGDDKGKGKDKKKDKDKSVDEKKNKSLTSLKEALTPSSAKKKDAKKAPNDSWTLWLQIGDFDPIPVDIDANMTVHDLKKTLQENEELELSTHKLHKIKLGTAEGLLDPRLPVFEQVENGSELKVILADDEQSLGNGENASLLKKEIDELKKQISMIKSQLDTNGGRVDMGIVNGKLARDSTVSSSSWNGSQTNSSQLEAIIKKSIGGLSLKLEDLETTIQNRNTTFDEAMKKLTTFTSSLKMLQGLPAVNNDIAPTIGNIPFMKPKETLTGHEGPVWSLARGDQLLFSSSSDTTVKIWDLKTLRAKTLMGHTDIIHCVAATPDDKMVISGSDDRTIRLWDVEQLKLIKSIEDDNIACCLRIAHGHLFSGSFKSVKVWNLQKQKQVHILPGHNHWVRAINVHGGYLFTGGHNVIKMFDMANFNLARTMQQNCGSIYGIVVSGNMLYAATYENSVLIWDLRSHEYVRSLAGHSGAVYSVCLDQENGKRLFSGSYDTSIRVWDLNTYKTIQRCTGHSSSVEALTMVDDKLFSGSTDATIKSWKLPTPGPALNAQ